jgi:hypothetical protein
MCKATVYLLFLMDMNLVVCPTKYQRLRMFDSGVLSIIFGPKNKEIIEGEEKYIMRIFKICIAH